MRLLLCLTLYTALLLSASPCAVAGEKVVSANGNDRNPGTREEPWKTLGHACPQLVAGDTLIVLAGEYRERIVVHSSGSSEHGYITIQGEPGAVISGQGVKGKNLVQIENKSYVKIIGLELTKNTNVRDGSGIRVTGHGSHIELRNNRIHEVRGKDAMGITVYGSDSARPIENLVIDGNEIYDCDPAKSEALTLNGNVSNFEVTNNRVHDMNNIGIDFIGGEDGMVKDRTKVTRNGLCKGNKVWRCRARYEGGFAAGIYVDGGRDIVIENNVVTECDLGVEVGAENKGTVVSGIVVRNNFIFRNDKTGIVFGGFEQTAGRVQKCKFVNNTCFQNDMHKKTHNGELWIQWASDNEVSGNSFITDDRGPLVSIDEGGVANNVLNHNKYFSSAGPEGARFMLRGRTINGFAAWQSTSKGDGHSVFEAVDVNLPSIAGHSLGGEIQQ